MSYKVYGGLIGNKRHIIAVRSKAEVLRIAGISRNEMQHSWAITRNEREVDITIIAPFTLFKETENHTTGYMEA